MNVEELIYKVGLRRGLGNRTLKTYAVCVLRFFQKIQKEPHTITKQDIHGYIDRMLERNAPGNTINVHLNALKFFYQEVLHRRLTLNIRYSKVPKHLPQFLTRAEIETIFRCITNPKHLLLIQLLYATGMRVSEIINLRIQDFVFDQNYGWVRQGKGRKDRLFIIPQNLREKLIRYIQENRLGAHDWLWQGQKNTHLSAQSVQLIIKSAAKKAGIQKNVHPHTLRHSFATHLIQNGYGVTEVQPLLGHSSITTTLVYLHMASPQLLRIQSPFDSLQLEGGKEVPKS